MELVEESLQNIILINCNRNVMLFNKKKLIYLYNAALIFVRIITIMFLELSIMRINIITGNCMHFPTVIERSWLKEEKQIQNANLI